MFIPVFILIFSILILVHEFGHFISAKILGLWVKEFGLGMPPKIFGKKLGETEYSINWIPFGGFVRVAGMDDQDMPEKLSGEERKRYYAFRPKRHRILVLIAGSLMNFLLGIVVFSFLFTQGVHVIVPKVYIEEVVKGSPAETAGLLKNDVIKKIKVIKSQCPDFKKIVSKDGFCELEIKDAQTLTDFVRKVLGEEIVFVIERKVDTELVTGEIKITPRKDYPADQGPTGIVISNFELRKYTWYQAPFLGTHEAIKLSWEFAKGTLKTIWKFVSFQPVAKEVAGPVGIAQLTGEAVKFGNLAVIELLGLLTINLAVVNLMPIPALDGGWLFFVAIETFLGRKVKDTLQRKVHQVGFFILIFLLVLITINDIRRIIGH